VDHKSLNIVHEFFQIKYDRTGCDIIGDGDRRRNRHDNHELRTSSHMTPCSVRFGFYSPIGRSLLSRDRGVGEGNYRNGRLWRLNCGIS